MTAGSGLAAPRRPSAVAVPISGSPPMPQDAAMPLGHRPPQWLAGVLVLLGGTVLAGWLGRWPTLTHVLPGMTGMVMQTALDFVLLGLALLMPRRIEGGRPAVLLPAILLLTMSTLNLLQIATGVELGLNLRGLHDWIADENPRPGQQATVTSFSFLIAALSLLALTAVRRPAPRLIVVGRLSALLLFVIALAAIIGYALRVEWLLNGYAFSQMALHTAFGLVVAAVVLWWRWDALDVRDGAEARELRGLVSIALVLTSAIASVTAVAVFRHEGERALEGSLSIARSSMVEGVQTVLSLRSTRAAIVTTRPLLRAGVQRLAQAPDDRDALAATRHHIEGFLGYGFSYIALLDADGRPLLHVGRPSSRGKPVLALAALQGGAAELEIGDGFLLRHRGIVEAGEGVRGVLITEQPLPELVAIMSSERRLGSSARSLLCGQRPVLHCATADGRLLAGSTALPPPPEQALDRVEHRIPQHGNRQLSSWQAVGTSGLLLSLSLDSTELYAPIRRGLYWGFLLVGIVTLLAVLLLRSRVAPLVARLARSEGRYHVVVESLSEGLMLVDASGRILTANRASERILGVPADQLCGRLIPEIAIQVFYEDGRPLSPDRFPATRTLASGMPVAGQVIRIDRADGGQRWISVGTTIASDIGTDANAGRSVVVSFADVTEHRRVEQELKAAGRLRQAIVDSAPFMVISTAIDGVITAFNPAAERMLWYRPEEVIGQMPTRFWDAQKVSQRATELSREIGRTIEPGFAVFVHRPLHGVAEEREWTLIRKDGSRFLVNMAVTALRDASGEVNGFLGIAYDITERKRREDYTRHVAHHDFLTGLPNRMLLNDRLAVALEGARRHRSRLAVMMLDLDHFKRINDSLGHHVGDLLLVEVAKRLQQTVRASDTVARLGGDEFVMLLPEPGNEPSAIEQLAQKIVAAVGAPMTLHGHELEVTPSLGVAVFPDDGTHADTLMKNADTALYRAKALGRNAYRVFSSDMAKVVDDRLTLEAAMRQALKRREFRLHYQPQVDLDSGAVIGMEALLRWTDPRLGAVSPATFIPVAEECGLILPLGEWVLRAATRDAVEMQQRSGRALQLAVNLSARQFRQNDLVEMVADALAVSGLPAAQLELEITEGALMVDTAETQARLKALRALGVSIAIDDFGVGFSSLSYVTRFDIDTLKIDHSFIAALPDSASDAAVARTVITLGQALGIKVVAEGVENDAQLAFLRGHRCDLGQGARFGMAVELASFSVQGFHFAAALAPDDFVAVLPRLSAIRA